MRVKVFVFQPVTSTHSSSSSSSLSLCFPLQRLLLTLQSRLRYNIMYTTRTKQQQQGLPLKRQTNFSSSSRRQSVSQDSEGGGRIPTYFIERGEPHPPFNYCQGTNERRQPPTRQIGKCLCAFAYRESWWRERHFKNIVGCCPRRRRLRPAAD